MKSLKTLLLIAGLVIITSGYTQEKKKNNDKKAVASTSLKMPSGWQGCSSVQPPMMKSIDSTMARGLADNYYLWEPGQTIIVKFLNGTPALKQKISTYAKEWENYANVKFNFVESGPANIRVFFNKKDGYWSNIGTQANSIDPNKHTLNLDTSGTNFKHEKLLRTTVVHEFGHALGLLHEHSSPNSNIPWNKELLYIEYAKSQGWTKEEIDAQVFATYKATYTNGTKYDAKSIMHYPISAKETIGGYSQGWNFELSEGDKELASILYPKFGGGSTEIPRFTISDFTGISVVSNAEKKGLDLYPSFNLKSQGQAAKIYFIAFFYDKNGNPLMDNDDKYNINGQVATFKGYTIPAGKNYDFNKAIPNDFGLNIPFSEFPLPTGSVEVLASFRVILIDEKANETKLLYGSEELVNCRFVK